MLQASDVIRTFEQISACGVRLLPHRLPMREHAVASLIRQSKKFSYFLVRLPIFSPVFFRILYIFCFVIYDDVVQYVLLFYSKFT